MKRAVFKTCEDCQVLLLKAPVLVPAQDACNRKSNQQNLGTIKCSNLCTEIVEYTSPEETAVCNLASIALPRYVREQGVPLEGHTKKLVGSIGSDKRYFDFDKLVEVNPALTERVTLAMLGSAAWKHITVLQQLRQACVPIVAATFLSGLSILT